jgi:hypothetical protein
LLDLTPGTALVLDGVEWIVERAEPQFGRVVLVDTRGRRLPANVRQLASRGGRRLKRRYRGTVKNNAWLTRRTAARNLRNLLGRGLTRTAGVWVLAAHTA